MWEAADCHEAAVGGSSAEKIRHLGEDRLIRVDVVSLHAHGIETDVPIGYTLCQSARTKANRGKDPAPRNHADVLSDRFRVDDRGQIWHYLFHGAKIQGVENDLCLEEDGVRSKVGTSCGG